MGDPVAVWFVVPVALLTAAAIGWRWSIRMADEMRADGMGITDMSSRSAMVAGVAFVDLGIVLLLSPGVMNAIR